jgi:hypothetical protein
MNNKQVERAVILYETRYSIKKGSIDCLQVLVAG